MAAVVVLAACNSVHAAATTTTTPGRVDPRAPFLRVVTADSKTPCRPGQVAGFGPEQDGKCFTLGTILARAADLSSYGVMCRDPSVGWTLLLAFTRNEGTRLRGYTREHTNAKVAIVEDDVVVFSGPLNGQLGRDASINDTNFHASELRRIGARSGAREQDPTSGILPPNLPIGPGSTITITPRPTGTQPLIGRCKTNDD